ncbi:MAG: ABC transporter ATP-binding protein, partial [Brachybacterium sp.]|nr:ABC transporter ATP-binding protein [Brachybacterium sp.]
DRYLLERVTDTQYAVLEGRVRHLPGGIDQYLRLRSEGVGDAGDARSASGAPAADAASSAPTAGGAATAPSGKERREAQKEVSSLERRIEKLEGRITALHADMAAHDPSDYAGLQDLAAEVRSAEDESAGLEERWLELSTIIEHS